MTLLENLSSRFFYLIPMGVLLLLFVVLRVLDPAPIAQLRLNVFDQYMRMSPRVADPDYPVRIIAIDDASLEALGQWPWPRSILADMVERLKRAGAKSISFDVILPEPDRMSPKALAQAFEGTGHYDTIAPLAAELPTQDERLAKAISNAPVVLGLSGENGADGRLPGARAAFVGAGDDPKSFIPQFDGGVASLSLLNDAARGIGAVNWIPDRDHILRRVPLLVSIDDVVYPSLVLETLRVVDDQSTIVYRASGGSMARAYGERSGLERVRIGSRVLATNSSGEIWLRFAPFDERRYVSAHEVLADDFDASAVAGRYVLFGARAVGLRDVRATALSPTVPGVEVHAQALEQMLAGVSITRPSYALGFEILFLVLGGLVLALLIGITGPLVAALAGVAAIGGVCIYSWMSYNNLGQLIDPVYPSLALGGLYVAGSLTTYVRTERERARVRAAFGAYVAPELVEELAEDPSKLKLGGETREVTLLFSDVRKFSRFAEHLNASELVKFVNRLFTPLGDIILEERGTIDKFMGDAVMAFWNAPVPDDDHARQACRAALRMMSALEELNGKWRRRVEARGEKYIPVQIGIGINTGSCCVGNVGTPQRFDYSILGDVVNVAARLESVTKTYGTGIIVGERTTVVAEGFAFVELDRVVLKGKSQAELIYALVGDDTVGQSAKFSTLVEAHTQLLALVRSKSWSKADGAVSRCEAVGIRGYKPVAQYFRGVIERG